MYTSLIKSLVGSLILLSVSACGLSYDNRERIAALAVYGPKMNIFDTAPLAGAINAQFPPGTPDEKITEFVHDLSGYCRPIDRNLARNPFPPINGLTNKTQTGSDAIYENLNNKILCEFPESGIICSAHSILMGLDVESGVIRHIQVARSNDGC